MLFCFLKKPSKNGCKSTTFFDTKNNFAKNRSKKVFFFTALL